MTSRVWLLRLANELDTRRVPFPVRLESMALAYAANGKFARALKLQQYAIKQGEALRYDTTRMRERLAAYSAQRPWRGYLAAEYVDLP